MSGRPALMLPDTEGTIAPIRVVHDVLFPYARVRFLSDAEAELAVASVAGLDACQIVRVGDTTAASADHCHAPDLVAVDAVFDRAEAG